MLSLGTLRLNLSERAESARNARVARDSKARHAREHLILAQCLISPSLLFLAEIRDYPSFNQGKTVLCLAR